MNTGLHVKYPLDSSDFNKPCVTLGIFSKNNQVSNVMKSRLVGAEVFHADGQTGKSSFSQFCQRA
jgi:hypothetical protein